MISTIIIDDEPHCTRRLEQLLQTNGAGQITVQATCNNMQEGFEAIQSLNPQLVFLDVQLPPYTGFDLLQRFSSIPFEVVFTTAYEQYAVKAFRFSAADYLLKPIDPDELAATIKKLHYKLEKKADDSRFELLFSNLRHLQQQTRKIAVPTASGIMFLPVQDIIRCQSNINYTTIYLKNQPPLVVAKTLKEFEYLLSEYNFYRIHSSHLVNMACIRSYDKGKSGLLRLNDNTALEVSSRRQEQFLQKMMEQL